MRKSYVIGIGFAVVLLAGCAGSNRAPISSIGANGTYAGGVYTVQRGDTLYSISRRYNVPVNRILSLNNISNPSQIEVGQKLRLNASASSKGSSASSTRPASSSSDSSGTPSRASDASAIAWGWPHKGNIITAYSNSTRGIDIAGKVGDPVYAAASGTVSYVGNGLRGLGNLVLITHSKGFISAYAHNSKLLVKQNQRVSKGQKIAELGQSDTTSPRLHFEIRRNGIPVNPQSYLPR